MWECFDNAATKSSKVHGLPVSVVRPNDPVVGKLCPICRTSFKPTDVVVDMGLETAHSACTDVAVALTKFMNEAAGKTNDTSDAPPPQCATSSEQPKIEDLHGDVTSQKGFVLPGSVRAWAAQTWPAVANTEPAPDPLKGVSGWLFVFCVATTILQPIAYLRDVSILTFFADIPLAAFAFYVGITLWRVRPNALKVVRVYFIVTLVCTLALAALNLLVVAFGASAGMYPSTLEKKTEMMTTAILRPLLQPALFIWIWWTYFKRSKRVRATYRANL